MPIDLAELLEPARTAVITVECQRGVIGTGGPLSALADRGAREPASCRASARVLDAARAAGAPVLHGIVVRRADGGGIDRSTAACSPRRARPAARDCSRAASAARLVPELGPGDERLPRAAPPRRVAVPRLRARLDPAQPRREDRSCCRREPQHRAPRHGDRGGESRLPGGDARTTVSPGRRASTRAAVLEHTVRLLATVRCDDRGQPFARQHRRPQPAAKRRQEGAAS